MIARDIMHLSQHAIKPNLSKSERIASLFAKLLSSACLYAIGWQAPLTNLDKIAYDAIAYFADGSKLLFKYPHARVHRK